MLSRAIVFDNLLAGGQINAGNIRSIRLARATTGQWRFSPLPG